MYMLVRGSVVYAKNRNPVFVAVFLRCGPEIPVKLPLARLAGWASAWRKGGTHSDIREQQHD